MLTQLLSIKGRKLETSLERNKQKRAIWQDPSRSIAADPRRTGAQCTLLAAFAWSWIGMILGKATVDQPINVLVCHHPFGPAQRGFFRVSCQGFLLGSPLSELSPSSQCSLTVGGRRNQGHSTPVCSDEELGELQNIRCLVKDIREEGWKAEADRFPGESSHQHWWGKGNI